MIAALLKASSQIEGNPDQSQSGVMENLYNQYWPKIAPYAAVATIGGLALGTKPGRFITFGASKMAGRAIGRVGVSAGKAIGHSASNLFSKTVSKTAATTTKASRGVFSGMKSLYKVGGTPLKAGLAVVAALGLAGVGMHMASGRGPADVAAPDSGIKVRQAAMNASGSVTLGLHNQR
jgi:hypothetical protein